MQCPSCGFENMPGSEGCARCGTSLKLATMTIETVPPRAGKWARRLRGRLASRWQIQGRDSAKRFNAAARHNLPTWSIFFRLVFPGWAHRFTGEPELARRILLGYLAMLAMGIAGYGTFFGDAGIAFAAAIHVGSAFDICLKHIPGARAGRRVFFAIIVDAVILLCLYAPPVCLGRWIAHPLVLQDAAGSFHPGDVLLVNELFHLPDFPRPGQIVEYNEDRHGGDFHVDYVIAGPRIDRILGVGGDHVVWDYPHLFVNGQPSPFQPLDPHGLPQHVEVDVPPGDVLLFPTVGSTIQMRSQWIFWANFAFVPRGDVVGVVYWRWGPFWRFGPVR